MVAAHYVGRRKQWGQHAAETSERGPITVESSTEHHDATQATEVVVPLKEEIGSPVTWSILPMPEIRFPDFTETIEKPFDMLGELLGDAPKEVLSDRGPPLIKPPVIKRQSSDGSNASKNNVSVKVYKIDDVPEHFIEPAQEPKHEKEQTVATITYPYEGDILPMKTFHTKTDKAANCVGVMWPSPTAFLNCGQAEARDDYESVEISAMDDSTVATSERPPEHILLNNEDPLMQQQLLMQQQILLNQQRKKQQDVATTSALARIGSSIRGGLGRQRKGIRAQAKEGTVEQIAMNMDRTRTKSVTDSRSEKRRLIVNSQEQVGGVAGFNSKVMDEKQQQEKNVVKTVLKAKSNNKKKLQEHQSRKHKKDSKGSKKDGERPGALESKTFFPKLRCAKLSPAQEETDEREKKARRKKSSGGTSRRDRDRDITRGRSKSRVTPRETKPEYAPKARSRSLEARPCYDLSPEPRTVMERGRIDTYSGNQLNYPTASTWKQGHYWEHPSFHRNNSFHPTSTMEQRGFLPYRPVPPQRHSLNQYENHVVLGREPPLMNYLVPPPTQHQYYTPRPYHTIHHSREQPSSARPMSGEDVEESGQNILSFRGSF
ncbi:hypothetical protein IV203_003933 [Nitzschia inconspicua]|uniref:Uncharacterized protein n=1 Tax=Nitzschia inconspicua TaxID=303405 RepID=A0A9K3L3A5_9STRA|nr:hypothetical protein IV203_003933 [Nitzschia inconspicua]